MEKKYVKKFRYSIVQDNWVNGIQTVLYSSDNLAELKQIFKDKYYSNLDTFIADNETMLQVD